MTLKKYGSKQYRNRKNDGWYYNYLDKNNVLKRSKFFIIVINMSKDTKKQ